MGNWGRIHRFLLASLVALPLAFAPCLCLAQEQASTNGDVFDETLGDLYLIAGLGAGGAILGLSTLSFVDKPTKHLKNIWIGGAIGIIVGVGVVAWNQATKSQETLRSGQLELPATTPFVADAGPASRDLVPNEVPTALSYSFDF